MQTLYLQLNSDLIVDSKINNKKSKLYKNCSITFKVVSNDSVSVHQNNQSIPWEYFIFSRAHDRIASKALDCNKKWNKITDINA